MSVTTTNRVIFDAELIEGRNYWLSVLSSEPVSSNIVLDHGRAETHLFQEDTIEFKLSDIVHERLVKLTGNSPFLVYSILMTSLKICLYKYTGNETIVVGSPALQELDRPNALVIVDRIDGGLPFRQLLLNIRDNLLEVYARQSYPFHYLVKNLRLEGVSNKCPLFDMGLALVGLHGEMPAVRNDITITCDSTTGVISGVVDFNSKLFDKVTVGRFVNHYLNILDQALNNTDLTVRDFEILTGVERHERLVKWNDTKTDYPETRCIHQLFEEQVERAPDRVAVEYEGRCMTYAEANTRANRLARYLRGLGVRSDSVVGVYLERSQEMVVGLLAILKAGAAYLPLDLTHPPDRLAFMLEDCRAAVVLTQEQLIDNLPDHAAYSVCVEADCEKIARYSAQNLSIQAAAEDLAYILYTSGSTGRPKGVMVQHRGLTNYLCWAAAAYDVMEGRGTVVHSPIGFDLTLTSLFVPLIAGQRMELLPEGQSIENLAAALSAREDLSLVKITPAHLEGLSQYLAAEEVRGRSRAFVIGGEALRREHVAFWRRHAPETRLINEYGPTETVVGCATYEVSDGGMANGAIPIGRPIANTQIYILDREMRPTPVGVIGEIYVSGEGVARGYLGEAELTALSFIANPFGEESGGRLYKTGDLGRYLEDGNIEYVGRSDHQVKVRGYRIELGEIEAALMEEEGVREAVVVANEGAAGDKRLIGYVVAGEGTELSGSELKKALSRKLPEYMAPAVIMSLEKLPLNANGKVDRKALPKAVSREVIGELEEYGRQRSSVEELLARIWSEVLGVGQIGVKDNFFELGGHSLLAIQVVSRISKVLGIEVSLEIVFDRPTIEELGRYIEESLKQSMGATASLIERVSRDQALPLSFAQQRLWFLDQMEGANPAYNVPLAVRLQGELNIEALDGSLWEIERRHEALRTIFKTLDGSPAQDIRREVKIRLSLIDLSGMQEGEFESQLQRLTKEEASRVFHLSEGPLWRVSLIKLGPQDHVLLLTMHHIVGDGWSVDVLRREIKRLYEAYSGGRPSPLEELNIQYCDYAMWHRNWVTAEALSNQIEYWKKQLRGAPALLEMPTDHQRPAFKSYRGGSVEIELSQELTSRLEELSRKQGMTMFMSLLSGFKALLYRYSGQEDILVGTPVAARSRVEIEGLIGFFVNMLVLRSNLREETSFGELLRQVREVSVEGQVNQDVQFERLVEELELERSLSYSPVFQVVFEYQNTGVRESGMRRLKLTPLIPKTNYVKFDLRVSLSDREGRIVGVVDYCRDLYEEETIGRMVRHYERLLWEMVKDVSKRVSQAGLLSEEETEEILRKWNKTEREYPKDKLIQEMFEEQVERSPDRIALEYEDECMTYEELNARANQLGRYLQGLGVGPEVMVGVFLRRSVGMVVAVMGALKAGGAYLPLDPEYPLERLAFMLVDAGVRVALTEKGLEERLSALGAQTVNLDEEWERIGEESKSDLEREVVAENLAYMIFTSGSTGKPKGTMIPHRGLTNYLNWAAVAYQANAGKGVPVHSAIGFDFTLTSVFVPLLAGNTLIILPESQKMEALVELLDTATDLSFVKVTPAHLQALEQMLRPEGLEGRTRTLIVGGEALWSKSLSLWREHSPSTRIINEYGPTETVVGSCVYEVPEGGCDSATIPIGRPIANTEIYILDKVSQPAPIGVIGEIHIGGKGVSRGYVRNADLTAEKFVPNPFGGEGGARLYRTGDSARYLADGNIEFLGRLDDQVKIRGFRIEVGEIEDALRQHPGVKECLVTPREGEEGEKRLMAYIVADRDQTPTVSQLRAFLNEKLPAYMIPSAFLTLESFPLTANGKVDRRALPDPDRDLLESESAYAPPTTVAEKLLAEIWSKVLRIDKIGIHDNYFEIGGESILAIKIAARAKKAGLKITPKQMFEHQTIAKLVSIAQVASSVEAEQGVIEGAVALTPIQRWLLEHNLSELDHFNMSMLLELRQSVDPSLLEEAVRQLLIHHDALRLSLVKDEAGWRQNNGKPAAVTPFTVVDLSGETEAEQNSAIEARSAEFQQSLDLSNGKLVQFALFQLGENRGSRLLIVAHHWAMDGVSWRILVEDLQTAYKQLSRGEAIEFARKTSSFKQWAEQLRNYAQSSEVGKELDYWLAQEVDQARALPVDSPGGENSESSARSVEVVLDLEETEQLLREVPKAYHTQINDALLTSLLLAWAECIGNKSLLVALEGHGREESLITGMDLTRTVGWFTTIYPALLEAGGRLDPAETLKSVKEQMRKIPNRGIGYGLLRYLSGDETVGRKLRALPQAEVSFNYLGQFGGGASESSIFGIASERIGPDRSQKAKRAHLLDVTGSVMGGRLRMVFTYSENLHNRETIEALAENFVRALRSLITHCLSDQAGGYTPSDFPLANLDQKQLDKLLTLR